VINTESQKFLWLDFSLNKLSKKNKPRVKRVFQPSKKSFSTLVMILLNSFIVVKKRRDA